MSEQQQSFDIQRIYTKELSYEAPNTPDIFQVEWKPEIHLDMDIKARNLKDDIYEVELLITATAKDGEKVAFLVEINQAGIFNMVGFTQEQLSHMQGSFCPSILYPYAREVVSELVTRGGFPPLYLAPVNFDALYAQQQEQKDGTNA